MELLPIILLAFIACLLIGLVYLFINYLKSSKETFNTIENRQISLIESLHKEIKQVQESLNHNNKEVEYNRLIPIVYSQLKRFEDNLNQFSFENTYGIDGLNYLHSKIKLKQTELFDPIKFTSQNDFEIEQINDSKKLIAFDSLATFTNETSKCITALESVLTNANCTSIQINRLQKLFLENINDSYYTYLSKVIEVARKRVKSTTNEALLIDEFIKENHMVKHLKTIIDFKKKELRPIE